MDLVIFSFLTEIQRWEMLYDVFNARAAISFSYSKLHCSQSEPYNLQTGADMLISPSSSMKVSEPAAVVMPIASTRGRSLADV